MITAPFLGAAVQLPRVLLPLCYHGIRTTPHSRVGEEGSTFEILRGCSAACCSVRTREHVVV